MLSRRAIPPLDVPMKDATAGKEEPTEGEQTSEETDLEGSSSRDEASRPEEAEDDIASRIVAPPVTS